MIVSARTMPLQIELDAPDEVREALDGMGRTEDVRLAPGGRRLAVACFARDDLVVADVEIERSASGATVAVTSVEWITSPALGHPHGIEFVDEDTLLVANRSGGIAVLRLGAGARTGETVQLPLLDVPGSLVVHEGDLLVCNNRGNTITRHPLDENGVPAAGEVIVRKWLDVPDGLAVSHDGRWLAVSNHNTHNVLVYDYRNVDEGSDPVCVLRGLRYPHGLRFGAGDGYLLVADAGAPYVHVFVPSGGSWQGVEFPAASIKAMDDDTFARGRHNPQEGGPKGIDGDLRTDVLVMTAECAPLTFFDLSTVLEGDQSRLSDEDRVRYELFVLEERGRLKADVAEARSAITEFTQTKAWRLTLPLRRAHEAALRLKGREH